MSALPPLLEAAARAGGIVSGRPVADDFERGWALHPFVGKVAHFWTADRSVKVPEVSYGLRSACNLTTIATAAVPLLAPGTYPHCQRCDDKLLRAMKPRRP